MNTTGNRYHTPRGLGYVVLFAGAVVVLGPLAGASIGAGWDGSHQLLLWVGLGASPISRVTQALERLKNGDYDIDLASDRDDEMGRLAEAVTDVASRLRAVEQSLRRHEEILEDERTRRATLFEHSSDCLAQVSVGERVRVTEINSRFETTFGCEDDDVVGEPLGDLLGRDEPTDEMESLLDGIRRGESVERELPLRTTGEKTVFGVRFVPVRSREDDLSSVESGYVHCTDVTEQSERGRAERLRRELYDITSDGTLDGDEKIERLLERGREWFGLDNGYLSSINEESGQYVVEEAVGDEFVDAGETVPLGQTFCRRTITTDGILGISDAVEAGLADDPGYCESGIACYLGARITVDDQLYGTFCFFDDEPAETSFTPTEKTLIHLMGRWVSYELERREKARERRLKERTLENAPVGITIIDATDPTHPIAHANDRFEAITGYDAEAVCGRSYESLFGDGAAAIADAFAAETATTTELCFERADGTTVWTRVRLTPVTDDDGTVTHFVSFQEDITEHREYVRRLEGIVENTTDPIYIKGLDGTYQFANEATADVFGLDRDEVIGRTDDELFDADSVADIRAPDQQVVDTGEPVTRETTTTVDDQERVFIDNKYPFRDSSGDIIGIMGISKDITERKRVEKRHRAERERFETLVQNLPGMMYRCRNEQGWPMSFVSGGCADLTGYDAETIERGEKQWGKDVIHPDDRERVWTEVQAAVDRNEPFQLTYRIVTADDEMRWVWEQGRAVEGIEGEMTMLEGYITDVTERKERERELEESRARYQSLVDNFPNGAVALFDADLRYLLVGGSLPDELGVSTDEIQGLSLSEVLPTAAYEKMAPEFEAALAGERRTFESTVGEQLRKFQVLPVRDEHGEMFAGMAMSQDVTERRRRERRLEQAETMFQHAQDGLFLIDVDDEFTIQRVNPAYESVTGLEAEDVVGKTPRDVVGEEYGAAIEAKYRECIQRRTPLTYEETLSIQGEPRDWETRIAPVVIDDEVRVLVGATRDITDRKERERELEQYEQILEAIDDVAFVVNDERTVRYINETGLDYLNASRDDIEGRQVMPLAETYMPEAGDRDQFEAALTRTFDPDADRDVPERVEITLDVDGDERVFEYQFSPLVEEGAVTAVAVTMRDVTERRRQQRELKRSRDFLRQTELLAGTGGWDIDADTGEQRWTDGTYAIHDIPPDSDFDPTVDEGIEYYHPDDRDEIERVVTRCLEHGEPYDVELRLITADGRLRWIRTRGEAIRENEDIVKIRGAIQDITERKRQELALQSLHDATRELLTIENDEAVADRIVDTAVEVLKSGAVALYQFDPHRNEFEPIAHTDAFDGRTGGAPAVAMDDDSLLCHSFVTGTVTTVDDDGTGEDVPVVTDADGGVFVPVGDYGVLAVVSESSPVSEGDQRLLETVAATTEAAFDRLESEARLRERERKLEAKNRRMERQMKIIDIIRDIDQSLIGAESRTEIEAAVCERLVADDDIAFAWVGGRTDADGALSVRTWAGDGEQYLDAISLDGGTEPAVVTTRKETSTVVDNVADDLRAEPWREHAIEHGYSAVVSVPLAVDDYSHGVLTVYAETPDVFRDLERSVFAELGENVANSIEAIHTRQSLHADSFVELRIQIAMTDTPLARIATETGGHVEYQGLTAQSRDVSRLFVTVTGATPDAVEEVVDDLVSVTDCQTVANDGDNHVFEMSVSGTTLPSQLVRAGGNPRSITASGQEMEVVVDVPMDTEVREFLERLQHRYDAVDLLGRRDAVRSSHTKTEVVASLFEQLTDRQLEVLQTAYHSGFFEWPRESTGEDVAEMLDVTQPTVNRHLRLAQQHLFEQLFGAETSVPTET